MRATTRGGPECSDGHQSVFTESGSMTRGSGLDGERNLGPRELLSRAIQEVAELGPEPDEEPERWYWREERRGALELLAALTNHDHVLLRRASLHISSDHNCRAAAQLLRDAARIDS